MLSFTLAAVPAAPRPDALVEMCSCSSRPHIFVGQSRWANDPGLQRLPRLPPYMNMKC